MISSVIYATFSVRIVTSTAYSVEEAKEIGEGYEIQSDSSEEEAVC